MRQPEETRALIMTGISPCPNDTFMFHGLISREVPVRGVAFAPVFEDIEALNQRAVSREGQLALTKLSLNALGQVSDRYTVLSSGAALGRGVGPLVVRPGFKGGLNDLAQLAGKRVAVPGMATTAYLLLRLFAPEFEAVPMRFDEIMTRVAMREDGLEAGLIIHESRFTYEEYGLVEIADLGAHWEQKTGLPLPLGMICAHRKMDESQVERIDDGLRRSIQQARRDPSRSAAFVKKHAQEMDEEVCRRHIELYVNDYSEELGEDGKASIQSLLRYGRELGLLPGDKPFPWR